MRWEDEIKKQTHEDTIIEMNPTDYSLNAMTEYTTEMVCVRRVTDTIRYKLLLILPQIVSYCASKSWYIIKNWIIINFESIIENTHSIKDFNILMWLKLKIWN